MYRDLRLLRHITCIVFVFMVGLNTDHNEVMKQLEVVSSRLLSKSTSSDNTEPMDIAASTSNRIALTHNTPFLTVDQVTPDSPADHAVSLC